MPFGGFAQETISLDATPVCGECAPHLILSAELDFARMNASPNYDFSFASAGDEGPFAVSSSTFPGEIAMFDQEGSFLRNIVRKGEGPGEYSGLITLRNRRGSIYAFDTGNRRFHRLTPDGGVAISSGPIAGTREWVAIGQDRILSVGGHPSGGQIYAISVIDLTTGEQEFAVPLTSEEIADPARSQPLVAEGPAGFATIAHRFGGYIYRISLQSLEVVWEGQITLEDMPAVPSLRPLNTEPPPKQIAGLSFSQNGDLWVFGWGPDERWGPGRASDGASLHELFDTTVFVLDRQLQIKAVETFDFLVMPGDNGSAATYLDSEDHVGVFRFWLQDAG
jgi:hypothetical protein